MHLLHITLVVKFLDEIIELNGANPLEYRQGLLVVPYISYMSHNSGGVTNLKEISIVES